MLVIRADVRREGVECAEVQAKRGRPVRRVARAPRLGTPPFDACSYNPLNTT